MKKAFIKNKPFPNENLKNIHKKDKTTDINGSTTSTAQNNSAKSRLLTHIQHKNTKKIFKPHDSQTKGPKHHNSHISGPKHQNSPTNGPKQLGTAMKACSLPQQTRPQKEIEVKESTTKKYKKQALDKSSLSSLNLTQNHLIKSKGISSSNDTAAQTDGEPANEKHKKRKLNSKKSHDGVSNWMKLCSTLNIEASVRKTKPLKRTAPEIKTDESHHSEPKRTKPGIWFDNVDKILLETDLPGADDAGSKTFKGGVKVTDTENKLVKPDSFKGVTNCVAMDCEMVGVGPSGEENILARVSVVNHFGVCLYDKFVLPREKVTDYRTYVSGVTAENLATGEEFTKVQKEVSDLLKGRILVGHALHNDLKVLFLTHPHKMIRDTSLYRPFRELFKGRLPSLKKLTDNVLGVQVQEGQHSSVQDAQAAMRLYTLHRQKWEKELRRDRKMNRKRKKKKQTKKENV